MNAYLLNRSSLELAILQLQTGMREIVQEMDNLKKERHETRPARQHPHQLWRELGGESHQRQQGREDHSPLHVQFKDPKSGSGKEDHARVPTPLKSGGNLSDEDEEAALEEAEVSTRGSITRSSPCYARRQRLQFEAHTCQKWSQIERRAEANINLSRRSVSPSELKVLGRGLSFVPKPKRIQQERLLAAFIQYIRKMRLRYLYRDVPVKKSKFRSTNAYTPGQTDNKIIQFVIMEMRN